MSPTKHGLLALALALTAACGSNGDGLDNNGSRGALAALDDDGGDGFPGKGNPRGGKPDRDDAGRPERPERPEPPDHDAGRPDHPEPPDRDAGRPERPEPPDRDAGRPERPDPECPPDAGTTAIRVLFTCDEVTVFTCKDLSNVVLELADGTHQKFEGLSGHENTFSATGEHEGAEIVGVWVKSGANHSGDGPGYGERFDAPDADCGTAPPAIPLQ